MKNNLLCVFGAIFDRPRSHPAFYFENTEKKETCVVKMLPTEKQKELIPYRAGEISLEDCKNMRDFLDKHIKEANGD